MGYLSGFNITLNQKIGIEIYSGNDFHPSKSGHKKFGEVVIQPLVNQIFNQLERSMKILGINGLNHDNNVCVIEDGEILFGVNF